MRKKQQPELTATAIVSCLLFQLILVGCSGNREFLETPLPQSYFLPNSINSVWEAALHEASKPTRRILVRDPAAHLLSWTNEIEPDEHLHASLTDPEVASEGDEGIAIAVIKVEAVPGGSSLMIRLTYCSPATFTGVSSSRGNYEQELLRAIRNSLITGVASHEKIQ